MNHASRPIVAFTVLMFSLVLTGDAATGEESIGAPGTPHLLPEQTLLYLRLDNADEFREDLKASSLGTMLNDDRLKPLANDMFMVLAEAFDQAANQLGVSLEEIMAIPRGQVAIAVMPGSPPEDDDASNRTPGQRDESEAAIRERLALKRRQQNSFAIFFMVEAGDRIDDVTKLTDRLESYVTRNGYVKRTSTMDETEIINLMPANPGPPELEYFVRDETLIFCIGRGAATDVLDRWLDKSDEPTLADRVDFASVMSRCIGAESTRPQLTFYLDAYHLLERVVQRQSFAAFFWPIVEQLGLSKIRGIGGSLFRGGEFFESIAHIHVLIDPPRDGLLGILRPEVVDIMPPDWVPADATSYTTVQWDFAKTYENIGKIMATFQRPDMLRDRIETPTQELLGLSFQDDLLANFTGRYATCRWIERPVKLNSQSTAHALQLNEPEKVKTALATFRSNRPQDVSVETIGGAVVYFVRSPADAGERRRGFFGRGRPNRGQQDNADPQPSRRPEPTPEQLEAQRQFREGLRKPEPCVVVLGDWAVYCDSRKLMQRLIDTHRNRVGRLISVPEYDLILSELGGKLDGQEPFMVSYLESADYVRQMYDLAQSPDTRKFLRARSEESPVSGKIVDLIERDELPSFEEFEKYFAPSGMFAYDEADGIHIGMFTLRAE